ncbi:hypothetical protein [Myroides sp. LoEW2-1]|uniref:hypothetical protein n=1 Tax=unclassified Myroides TaxID=2642485 RepID=UPI0013232B62|nr:hypothetical protein [Myroides sp. LoEW2-1]MVX36703.1 hypothetical protein [Myroides sp. LoEW2-1]
MNKRLSQGMQNLKTYRFYITQLQPTYFFLLSLFGGLLLMIVVPVIFLLKYQGQSIYILYLIGFVLMSMTGNIIYSVWKWRKVRAKYAEPEKIILRTNRFNSQYFGIIRFEDINSYSIRQSLPWINWNMASPTLKIKLQNEKVIRFHPKPDQNNTELEEYLIFLSDFTRYWEVYKQNLNKETSFSSKKTISSPSLSPQENEYETAIQAIAKARKKKLRKNIVIPFSFIIGFVLFARFFGGKIIEYYKTKPMRDMMTYSQQRIDQYPVLLRNAIAEEGAIYMYTNDSLAKLHLVPYIKSTKIEELDQLNALNTDTQILNFLTHPKERNFYLSLENENGVWKQLKSSGIGKPKEPKSIKFLLDNSEEKETASNLGLQFVGHFIFESEAELKKQLYRHAPMFNNRSHSKQLQASQPKWYLIAMESEGMDLESFQIASKTIVEFLNNDQDITFSFHLYKHNGNGDPVETPPEEITDSSIKELQETIEIRKRIKGTSHKNQ